MFLHNKAAAERSPAPPLRGRGDRACDHTRRLFNLRAPALGQKEVGIAQPRTHYVVPAPFTLISLACVSYCLPYLLGCLVWPSSGSHAENCRCLAGSGAILMRCPAFPGFVAWPSHQQPGPSVPGLWRGSLVAELAVPPSLPLS